MTTGGAIDQFSNNIKIQQPGTQNPEEHDSTQPGYSW